jgi:peptidyl-prolyl isomerase E (cyclophilin E)
MDEETRLRTLYVGGLAEEVTEEILRSVFIAFGDVKDVQIPQDFGTSAFWCAFAARAASALSATAAALTPPRSPPSHPLSLATRAETHRGFGFVTMDERDDARDAIDNLHNCELYGRVLTVNTSKKMTSRLGAKRAVWEGAGAKEWFTERAADGSAVAADAATASAAAAVAGAGARPSAE